MSFKSLSVKSFDKNKRSYGNKKYMESEKKNYQKVTKNIVKNSEPVISNNLYKPKSNFKAKETSPGKLNLIRKKSGSPSSSKILYNSKDKKTIGFEEPHMLFESFSFTNIEKTAKGPDNNNDKKNAIKTGSEVQREEASNFFEKSSYYNENSSNSSSVSDSLKDEDATPEERAIQKLLMDSTISQSIKNYLDSLINPPETKLEIPKINTSKRAPITPFKKTIEKNPKINIQKKQPNHFLNTLDIRNSKKIITLKENRSKSVYSPRDFLPQDQIIKSISPDKKLMQTSKMSKLKLTRYNTFKISKDHSPGFGGKSKGVDSSLGNVPKKIGFMGECERLNNMDKISIQKSQTSKLSLTPKPKNPK